MRESDKKRTPEQRRILTQEQDDLMDLYIQNLDNYFEAVKASEKIQVEIETLHLKRILSK